MYIINIVLLTQRFAQISQTRDDSAISYNLGHPILDAACLQWATQKGAALQILLF